MAAEELCKTLIVDDEILIRQGIKHYLDWESEGFSIVGEAGNGREALALIEKEQPHIVITDVVMPVMDGEELAREVKERFPAIKMIVLSSFGEFEYVRAAFQNGVVDYILKPKLNAEVLLKALRSAAKDMSLFAEENKNPINTLSLEHQLQRMIAGKETQFDSAEVKRHFPFPLFQLIFVTVKGEAYQSPDIILQDFLTMRTETAFQLLQAAKNKWLIVYNSSRPLEEKELTAIPVSGAHYTGTAPFKDSNAIAAEYHQVLQQLLHYRFYLSEQPVLAEHKLPPLPPDKGSFELDLFISQCKQQKFDRAFSYLQKHVRYLSAVYTWPENEFKSFLNNIIFNVFVLIGNMDHDLQQLNNNKYRYFEAIEDAASADEAINWLQNFILEIKSMLAAESRETSGSHMDKLTAYIEAHYDEALSLTELAKHFHFSPSYLSSYFAAHNKEGFSEYVNKLRISKAQEILAEEDVPISKISERVGFSDHSYFCRVFKRMTGYSPSQYRRKYAAR